MNYQKKIHQFKFLYKEMRKNRSSDVRFFYFWDFVSPEEVWFHKFIQSRKLNTKNRKINFYSVFNPFEKNIYLRKGINIFFTGENLHADRFNAIDKHYNSEKFDLSLGFDILESEKYIRHPLWLHYMFSPDSTFQDIKEKVKELSFCDRQLISSKNKFCSLVASHDRNGIRGEIMNKLSEIDVIDSAGAFRHNTNDLSCVFNNQKHDFIGQYKFNICPENSNMDGYVTEKVFQAVAAGCVPVYWGANNCPEENVLNQDAILFWNQTGDNKLLFNIIKELYRTEKSYLEFAAQPRLKKGAEDVIWNYFDKLEKTLKELLTQ